MRSEKETLFFSIIYCQTIKHENIPQKYCPFSMKRFPFILVHESPARPAVSTLSLIVFLNDYSFPFQKELLVSEIERIFNPNQKMSCTF
jgi:hypothetical protein